MRVLLIGHTDDATELTAMIVDVPVASAVIYYAYTPKQLRVLNPDFDERTRLAPVSQTRVFVKRDELVYEESVQFVGRR